MHLFCFMQIKIGYFEMDNGVPARSLMHLNKPNLPRMHSRLRHTHKSPHGTHRQPPNPPQATAPHIPTIVRNAPATGPCAQATVPDPWAPVSGIPTLTSDKLAPAIDNLMPANDNLMPAINKLTPAIDNLMPANDNLSPAIDNLRPANDNLSPASNNP